MHHLSSFDIHLPLAILDVLPNPILIKGQDMRYVWVNAAFEKMFGVDRDTIIGLTTGEVWPDATPAGVVSSDRYVMDTGEVDERSENIFPGSELHRHVMIRKSRLDLPSGAFFLIGVVHDMSELMATNSELEATKKRLEDQAGYLERLANKDSLTDCLNRRALINVVTHSHAGPDVPGLLLMDLDFFKRVNDDFGHAAGDAVLKQFCKAVRGVLDGSHHFARLGGEEFAIFVPQAQPEELEDLAAKICRTVAATPTLHGGHLIDITVSIGVSWGRPGDKPTLDHLLRESDIALYAAKSAGRNRFRIADKALRASA